MNDDHQGGPMVDIRREIINRMVGSFDASLKYFDFSECVKIMMMRDLPCAEFRIIELVNIMIHLKGGWV